MWIVEQCVTKNTGTAGRPAETAWPSPNFQVLEAVPADDAAY